MERRPSSQSNRSSAKSRGRRSSSSSSSSKRETLGTRTSDRGLPRRKSTLKRRPTIKRQHRSRASVHDDEDERHDEIEEREQDYEDDEEEEERRLERSSSRRRSRRRDGDGSSSVHSQDREMTLKDRQEAMNREHPFGMPIWKPALYRKSRSVVRKANLALHASPMGASSHIYLNPGNILWTLLFGWWLALVTFIISLFLRVIPPHGREYSTVTRGMAFYLLWPFGRYVERIVDYVPEAQSQEAPDEETGLLHPRPQHKHESHVKAFLTQVVKSGPTGWIYYLFYFTVIGPLLLITSTICWMCVITIPMSKLTYRLFRHMRRHPLSLRFPSGPFRASELHPSAGQPPAVILLCTYQAIGLQYYKYTYEGINIIFINLLSLVFFVIFDEYVLRHHFPDSFIASPFLIFVLSLGSVIPLSYFIGMGVSSVSAQTSMAVGAVINATFGSIIEIILYAIALMGGKSTLVEGSLIGSILVGVLLLPGSAMVGGGIKRKEQKFNAKSAGVTSTMLIMAIIGALSPTLFYQMFGSFELRCTGCPDEIQEAAGKEFACSQCHYDQMNLMNDPVYQNNVKPFMWMCALILPSAYIIGMVFSLHTHVDMVWKTPSKESHERRAKERGQQSIVGYTQKLMPSYQSTSQPEQPHQEDGHRSINKQHAMSEPSMQVPIASASVPNLQHKNDGSQPQPIVILHPKDFDHEDDDEDADEEVGGHDSPNWGKTKSFTVLFACTLLYSIIAEILIDTVDFIMADLALDEKFLGLTLFALVPNITEFVNAIGFSMHGNIVLSMEIGSAYALQVCLLQIPAMVAFSLWYNHGKEELARFTFSLIFPRWDVIAVIMSVFLLTYTYQEGKSNYFKGSILILSYFVLIAGFYFIPSFTEHSVLIGLNPMRI